MGYRILHVALGSNLIPAAGVKIFMGLYRESFRNVPIPITMRHRVTKFCMWLYLVGFYQECPNNSPGVKFGPSPGVAIFTWAYIVKTLEIFLYLAMRPRVTKFCMLVYIVILHQKCPNYIPWVKFGPAPWVTSFTWAYMYIVEILELCTEP